MYGTRAADEKNFIHTPVSAKSSVQRATAEMGVMGRTARNYKPVENAVTLHGNCPDHRRIQFTEDRCCIVRTTVISIQLGAKNQRLEVVRGAIVRTTLISVTMGAKTYLLSRGGHRKEEPHT